MSFADLRIDFPSLRPKMRDFPAEWNKIYRYRTCKAMITGDYVHGSENFKREVVHVLSWAKNRQIFSSASNADVRRK